MTIQKLKLHTNIVNNDNLERRIFFGMLGFLATLFIAYMFFLGNITFNIVERRVLDNNIKELNSNIGSLEVEYLSLSNKIDMNLASNLGFEEAKNPVFVSRQPVAMNFSFKNNGI